MQDSTIEREREALIQLVTEAYSRGDMEMPAFERAVTRLNVCADRSALEAEAGVLGLSLPVLAPQMVPPQAAALGRGLDAYRPAPPSTNPLELSCVSGSIRMTGEWVKARTIRLFLKSSNARLDLTEYEGARGFTLYVDVDAVSSNLRIIVPEGFEVEDRFTERVSSTVRNKPKSSGGGNLVVLTGYLRSSTVRIKYR